MTMSCCSSMMVPVTKARPWSVNWRIKILMWKAICFPVTMAINWLLRVDWNTPRGMPSSPWTGTCSIRRKWSRNWFPFGNRGMRSCRPSVKRRKTPLSSKISRQVFIISSSIPWVKSGLHREVLILGSWTGKRWMRWILTTNGPVLFVEWWIT